MIALRPETLLTAARLAEEVYHAGTDVDDLRYLVTTDNGIAFLALRGTSNAVNAIRDMRVLPPALTPSGCLGHRGVVLGYRKLIDAGILCEIKKDFPIIIVGHSLGGGLALPFAELLNAPAVTFGAMRVYLRGMAPKLDHYRIINDDDPVPALPGISCDHDCKPYIVFRDYDDEWMNVKDHDMSLYVNRLKKRLNKCVG